ncbi:hypothetical protein KIL84_008376 [Mauremys mutica]|uniref:Uncharacterized protein n=1 Tax=Mauremys mutica TaxID=74926 RepID=A0A9D3X9P6_9SAUR|nr:hypothetical protein KIL84_008376 [Mauremys mutica]
MCRHQPLDSEHLVGAAPAPLPAAPASCGLRVPVKGRSDRAAQPSPTAQTWPFAREDDERFGTKEISLCVYLSIYLYICRARPPSPHCHAITPHVRNTLGAGVGVLSSIKGSDAWRHSLALC